MLPPTASRIAQRARLGICRHEATNHTVSNTIHPATRPTNSAATSGAGKSTLVCIGMPTSISRERQFAGSLQLRLDHPVPPVAAMKLFHHRAKVRRRKIGPHLPQEKQFRVCTLPQQKVAERLLAAGADEHVHIRRGFTIL